MQEAVAVGCARRQHVVVAGDQPHFDRRARLRARQRMNEHVDAVVAAIGGQSEIGDDEPLRGEVAIVIARDRFLGLGGHDIDAGAQRAERLVDRKRGGHFGVELLRDGELAAPHFGAALTGDGVGLIVADVALEVVADQGVDQIAVADAIDVELDRAGVHAQHRNAALAGARQHIGLAGEAHERFAVAHEDGVFGRFCQRLMHGRGQAGAQRDLVALAVLQALDAELFVG